MTYDNSVVGGLVAKETEDRFECDFHAKERITDVRVHTGVNGKGTSVIFGLEVISVERSCGLLGVEGTNTTLISGHQLLFVSGKAGKPNFKQLTFHFDYGCTSILESL